MDSEDVWYRVVFRDQDAHNESMDVEGVFVKRSETWNAVKRELIKQSQNLEGFTVGMIKLYESEKSFDLGKEIRDLSEPVGGDVGKDALDPFIVAVSAANSKKVRLSAGRTITEQPRSVWYTVVRDTIDGVVEAPAASVPMRPQQLLYDLKVHCKPPDHSRDIANFEDHIKIYDSEKNPLDGYTPIEGLDTTVEKPLRVELPREYKIFEWKPLNPSSSLNEGKFYFVNRDSAVRSLLKVCINNDQRKNNQGGPEHQIAIVDQNYGMGKTEFGNNFISQCKNVKSSEFIGQQERLDQIKRCRTLPITFPQGSLNLIMRIEDELLISKLEAAFRNAILESVGTHISMELVKLLKADLESHTDGMQTSARLLTLLMTRTGKDPIFVVLDEMGAAFDGPQDDQTRRQLFIGLCNKLLVSWLHLVGLYFLIVGHGALFDWVGDRPYVDTRATASSFKFKRITFNMIRE